MVASCADSRPWRVRDQHASRGVFIAHGQTADEVADRIGGPSQLLGITRPSRQCEAAEPVDCAE